ncbi:unnamed protein product [Sphenostylis stenocarpa]|uniref:Nuclear transcription factor Y subunit n=1 Tax=Sphenostylis stenocarpa TaxID=92480 RepID=A0AA86VHQ0_9FABA|nr:unnamed protein product [Sphenostylis stenocarpa]
MNCLCENDCGLFSSHSTSPSVSGCPLWGTSQSRSLSLKVDLLPQQCHRSTTLSFHFQDQDSSSTQSDKSYPGVGSAQSGIGFEPYGLFSIRKFLLNSPAVYIIYHIDEYFSALDLDQMYVQHSSTGSTLGTTGGKTIGCVIRSFMGSHDFTYPPPLLDHSQTLAHIARHYADPCYSSLIASSYGPQCKIPRVQPVETAPIRIPLPLDFTEEPIYVNSKQYHAILRRRHYRAKLEGHNKPIKDRKPYLHESRHLHALKRARGAGGRFLNTKKLQPSNLLRGNTAESNMHQMQNYRDCDNARNMQNYTSDEGGGGPTQHHLFFCT